MFDKPTMTDDECSPWPPVLWHTPEVRSGIEAATDLAELSVMQIIFPDADSGLLEEYAARVEGTTPALARHLRGLVRERLTHA